MNTAQLTRISIGPRPGQQMMGRSWMSNRIPFKFDISTGKRAIILWNPKDTLLGVLSQSETIFIKTFNPHFFQGKSMVSCRFFLSQPIDQNVGDLSQLSLAITPAARVEDTFREHGLDLRALQVDLMALRNSSTLCPGDVLGQASKGCALNQMKHREIYHNITYKHL